jgi:hypothetical protein
MRVGVAVAVADVETVASTSIAKTSSAVAVADVAAVADACKTASEVSASKLP